MCVIFLLLHLILTLGIGCLSDAQNDISSFRPTLQQRNQVQVSIYVSYLSIDVRSVPFFHATDGSSCDILYLVVDVLSFSDVLSRHVLCHSLPLKVHFVVSFRYQASSSGRLPARSHSLADTLLSSASLCDSDFTNVVGGSPSWCYHVLSIIARSWTPSSNFPMYLFAVSFVYHNYFVSLVCQPLFVSLESRFS